MDKPYWAAKMFDDKHLIYSTRSGIGDYRPFEGKTGTEYNESSRRDIEEHLHSNYGYKQITRAEFLALIKSFGLNEDGTKIVAPKTELELVKEELAAAKARISVLESKIAAAKKELS